MSARAAGTQGGTHAIEDGGGSLEVGLTDLRTQAVGPDPLLRLDRGEGRLPRRGEPEQLGAPVAGVVLVGGEALVGEQVRGALDALARELEGAGDVGDGARLALDRGKDLPPGGRLSRRLGEGVAGG